MKQLLSLLVVVVVVVFSATAAADKEALVVYYSRTGATAAAARKLSEHLGGDIVELKPRADDFAGLWGWLRAGYIGARRRTVELEETTTAVADIGSYRQVWVATPVHAGRLSGAMRTWLTQNAEKLRAAGVKVNALCTQNSNGCDGVFAEISGIVGVDSVAEKVTLFNPDVDKFDPATVAAANTKPEPRVTHDDVGVRVEV